MRSRALQAAVFRPLQAAVAYFAIVFAAGFILGTIRVVVLEPVLGGLAAVAVETPVILTISWIISGLLIRRFDIAPALLARLMMGVFAFCFLLAAELNLSMVAFGRSAAEFAAGLAEPAGLLGLSAQLVFAAMPALRLIGMQRR
jgi:hypothetical protein